MLKKETQLNLKKYLKRLFISSIFSITVLVEWVIEGL